jgi:hypothetical protein
MYTVTFVLSELCSTKIIVHVQLPLAFDKLFYIVNLYIKYNKKNVIQPMIIISTPDGERCQ